MTAFPHSPRLLKASLVVTDPASGAVLRVIALQYNPDTLSRTLQVRGIGAEAGDRLEAQRLTGPPVETIKLEAEIDATDGLEQPDQNPAAAELGVHPQLAALELLAYPASGDLVAANRLAAAGTLEILPAEAPFVLFVWSKQRILPVRVTDFSVTEEAFDPNLNPIRAKVSLGLRVLSVNDLPFAHPGSGFFLAYLQQKERLAARGPAGTLAAAGLSGLT